MILTHTKLCKKHNKLVEYVHEQLSFLGYGILTTDNIPETTEIFGFTTDNIPDNRFFKHLTLSYADFKLFINIFDFDLIMKTTLL